MDIASSAYGQYAGDLLVASEGSGRIRAVTVLQSAPGVPVSISLAETVSTVPLNLGSSGKSRRRLLRRQLYPVNDLFAAASQFAGLQGDAIVTSEFGSNSALWTCIKRGSVEHIYGHADRDDAQ